MTNYKEKLESLRSRRLGKNITVNTYDSVPAELERLIRNSYTAKEHYEQRANGEATRYALGSMQEVDSRYTEISYEEGNRVIKQLQSGLSSIPLRATFELQGSVPLNVHIRGVSDVDILVLHDEFVTLDWNGPKASTYVKLPDTPSALNSLQDLRKKCEDILSSRYPAATVDISGDKSIALSGGSLKRKVDVVPSHWHHSSTYQYSNQKYDKEVRILHKSNHQYLSNHPFLHIHEINKKNEATNHGVKKVIRLLKNIKNDSEENIHLSSYDIASLVWHFDNKNLTKPNYLELSLVGETQQSLESMIQLEDLTKNLMTPDKSRKIIDSDEKWRSLKILNKELISLSRQIVNEIEPLLYYHSLPAIRKKLNESNIY
jgi:hypothetical protein